jgi:hypothetical protein
MRCCASLDSYQNNTVQLRFNIRQKLEFGKRLCVVGSPKELGVWNAAESTCSLSWSDGDVWTGSFEISPGPVEFKLVQVSDHEVIWPEGNNVTLLIPDTASGVDVTGEETNLNLTILGDVEVFKRNVVEEGEGRGVAEASEVERKGPDESLFETLTLGTLEDLKVAELKKMLKDRGLPVSGRKAELIERLTMNG